MREALAIVSEEGLDAMWARHEAAHKQLWEGLTAMGLEPFVKNPADRLVTVNTIKVRSTRTAATVAARDAGNAGLCCCAARFQHAAVPCTLPALFLLLLLLRCYSTCRHLNTKCGSNCGSIPPHHTSYSLNWL